MVARSTRIPPEVLSARLANCAKLVAIVHATVEQTLIIVGRNVDTTWLPQGPGIPPWPVPSIHHEQVDCQLCGDKIWLGPTQMKAQGWRICYLCHAVMLTFDDTEYEIRAANPDNDKAPRRPE